VSNPFQYGAELKTAQMVNRKEEIRDVTRTLLEHGRLFLIGPRRHGKTAILRAASATARRQGALVLSLDAESYAGLDELVRALVAEAATVLKSDVARTGEKILAFFSRLRPVIAYNPADGEWSATIATEAGLAQTPLFIEALDGVARLARQTDKPVAVVIDEFQKVIEWGGENAEGQIRAAIQRHGEVGFVFAGSKTSLLNDMTLNPARPFYRMGARHFLGPLPRDEFRPFIARGFESAGHKVDPKAVEDILDLAEDVPYNVQALSSVAWEMLRDKPDANLSPPIVRQALELLISRDSPFYVTLWNALTEVQKRLVRAVIREKGVELASNSAARRHGVALSTVSRTLRLLEERQVLRREEQEKSVRWRFEDPFFAAWLSR
jgi:uncharacterized protein